MSDQVPKVLNFSNSPRLQKVTKFIQRRREARESMVKEVVDGLVEMVMALDGDIGVPGAMDAPEDVLEVPVVLNQNPEAVYASEDVLEDEEVVSTQNSVIRDLEAPEDIVEDPVILNQNPDAPDDVLKDEQLLFAAPEVQDDPESIINHGIIQNIVDDTITASKNQIQDSKDKIIILNVMDNLLEVTVAFECLETAPNSQEDVQDPFQNDDPDSGSDDDVIEKVSRRKKRSRIPKHRHISTSSDSEGSDDFPRKIIKKRRSLDSENSDEPILRSSLASIIDPAPPVSLEVIVHCGSSDSGSPESSPGPSRLQNTNRRASEEGSSDSTILQNSNDFQPVPTLPSALESVPSMLMKRDPATYNHFITICSYLKEKFTQDQIKDLKENAKSRNCLFENLVELGRLKNRSAMEKLPIYIFLMAPKTQKAYLEGWNNGTIPTRQKIHEYIFKASLKSDEKVAEHLGAYKSGKMNAEELRMKLGAIRNSEDDVRGVTTVDSLDEVPDGANLACFQEMPGFQSIRDKKLNCVVVDPSAESENLINQFFPKRLQMCIKGSALGKTQNHFGCKCFGPDIMKSNGDKKPTSEKLASLFKYAKENIKGTIREKIYVVDGFFD